MINVFPVQTFSDNYIWVIADKSGTIAIVVDPGDHKPVLHYLEKNNLKLTSIFITHHHMDHTGGLGGLLSSYNVPVYGSYRSRISGVTEKLKENDVITPPGFETEFRIFETPGHTDDHIVFYSDLSDGYLFTGDHLFSCGCGRIFEGTFDEMFNSLQKLSTLPESTLIYPGHEYTEENLRFAAAVDPDNAEINNYMKSISELIDSGKPSLPSTLAIERKINPFLRSNDKNVKSMAEKRSGNVLQSESQVFKAVREWKNAF